MSHQPRETDDASALSDAEWRVMQAVWARGTCRAREVHDDVADDTGWSYSTVRTLLARLVAKGAVVETKDGQVGVYAPRITRQTARRSALRRLLDRAFGGAVDDLVHHLVADQALGRRERRRLRELLDAIDAAAKPEAGQAPQTDAAADEGRARRRRTR